MTNFPNCPRCHSEWFYADHGFGECSNCNCNLKCAYNYDVLIFTFSDDTWVAWYRNENMCRYFLTYKKYTILPYLPYNITLDKLKLYLNFL